MKKSEIIKEHYNKIIETMVEKYEAVLGYGGRIEYTVYIWDDGEIECLEDVQGGTTFLRPNQFETRQLYTVCTIEAPCFDPWDYADHSAPDDEDEREAEETEIIEWLVDEYKREGAEAALDAVIDEAEQEEYWNA